MILNEYCAWCGGEQVVRSHTMSECVVCGNTTYSKQPTNYVDSYDQQQLGRRADVVEEIYFNGAYTTFNDF